jgi:hypothetical protein
MISIIVSTYRKAYYEQLAQSVENTIGAIPYELIPIENNGNLSIGEAYNRGARQAVYPVLCFVHEDVIFETVNWGKRLCNCFEEDATLGAIGIAGGFKTCLPTGAGSGIKGWSQVYVQHIVNNQKEIIREQVDNRTVINVLDGVLIFTTQSVWQEFKFDETIKGFHFYDVDFTFRISKKYKLKVSDDLLITHCSTGNFSDQWILAAIDYHKRKKDLFKEIEINKKEIAQIRNFYYRFSQPGMIETKTVNKIKYVCALGVDKYSVKNAIRFLILNPFSLQMLRKWHFV